MPDRAAFAEEFAFTEPQKRVLFKILKRGDDKAQLFIQKTAYRTTMYRADRRMFREDPIPLPKKVRELFARLESLAKELAEGIEQLDPVAGQADIIVKLWRMNRPADSLERLVEDLRWFEIAVAAARPELPEPRDGHPEHNLEIGFIAEVAADYRRIFGRLPPKSRSCRFHLYIQEVLTIACPDDVFAKDRCSRLVQKAVERVAEFSKLPAS